jgi:S-disulfanyl-L-cysteine oxidoreductase SoxD
MKARVIGVALCAAWAASVAAQAERSVKEGVYTEEQAKRGEAVYAESCANCHGEQMEGIDMSPPLTGSTFGSNWNTLTVGDLFDRIRTTMPMDRPGSITPQQNADVIAFMLKANQHPAGKTELPSTVTPLKTIKIEAPTQ